MLLHARSTNRKVNGRSDSSRTIYVSIISLVAVPVISAGRIHLIKERINTNAGRLRTNENKRYIAR